MKINIKQIAHLLILSVLVFVSSCTKEYETAPTPYNEITSFKIAFYDGQDTIQGIIEGETIHIVWPGMTEWPIPETVAPEITVSQNASVFPASGTAIPLVDGTTYTVTAQDGSTKTYKLQVTNGALLPAFINEDPITLKVGESSSIVMYNLALDGSDSISLVNDKQEEYKLILASKTYLNFITDVADGSGIPAGDYYVKVINKYRTPVVSSTKMVTVSGDREIPYLYFDHKAPMQVKRGETFTVPIRHFGADYAINRVRFYYLNASTGYASSTTLQYIGTNADYTAVTFQVPATAPTGISLYNPGLEIRFNNGNNVTVQSMYYPYTIQIVE